MRRSKKLAIFFLTLTGVHLILLPARTFQKDRNIEDIEMKITRNKLFNLTTNMYFHSESYKECKKCEAPSLDNRFEDGCDSSQIALRRCWWARKFCCDEEPSLSERSICSKFQVKYLKEEVITRSSYRENINKNLVSYRHGGDRLDSWILQIIGDYPSQPCLIIDVGANMGKNTKAYVKRNKVCEIHAFEPILDTYKVLLRNLEKDSATSFALKTGRLNVHKIGVGAASEVLHVESAHRRSGSGSLLNKASSKSSFEVRVETISEFFKDFMGQILFLKIDAEGLDLQVIRGMENLLASKKVISFIWEHHGSIFMDGNIGLAQAEIQYVSSFGYHIYIAGSEIGNLKTLRVDGNNWRRFYEIQGKGVWLAGVVDFFAIVAGHPFEKIIYDTVVSPRCLE